MNQPQLFSPVTEGNLLPYGGSALYYDRVFEETYANQLFLDLMEGVDWHQEFVNMYGKRLPIPRQTAWFGDPGARYTYSKITNTPEPWTPLLLAIKAKVEAISGSTFNSVLLNLYRNGSDSVAWHADDEDELGDKPTIGSVSFGATRAFQFKSISRDEDRVSIALGHGSVLVMSGEAQRNWLHQIPKVRKLITERINLTFRLISANS